MFKFQKINHLDQESCIEFHADKRKDLFQNLDQNKEVVSMMHYFPLSKEKYLIEGTLKIELDEEYKQKIWQQFSIE